MTNLAELLTDKPVLIVEDDVLIATYGGDLFSDLGCKSVVAAYNLAIAIDELKTGKPSLALLDLKLGTAFSHPVAEMLARENVPIIFSTGFDSATIEKNWASYPVLTKPYSVTALSDAVTRALARSWGRLPFR